MQHRLLNTIASRGGEVARKIRQMKHFNLDHSSGDYLHTIINDGYAHEVVSQDNHPFTDYTFSFFSNSSERGWEEILVIVRKIYGIFAAGAATVGIDEVFRGPNDTRLVSREDAYGPVPINVPNAAYESTKAKAVWEIVDAFRYLLSQPGDYQSSEGRYEKRTNENREQVIRYFPSEITITLEARKRLRIKTSEKTGRTVGQHDVRSHYCHRHADPSCNHVWVPHISSTPEHGRWECASCGGKRFDRKGGKRGDPSKPVPPKTYRIKKGGDIL